MQDAAVLSAHEAELSGAVPGIKAGITIRNLVEEMLEQSVKMKLDQDNQATIRTIIYEVTSWRTRYYAIRAAWVRDTVKSQKITVEHEKGISIIADPLTKVLPKLKVHEAWVKLQIERSVKVAE